MNNIKRFFTSHLTLLIGAGLPLLIVCVLILLYARNVPVLDQWEFALFIQKFHQTGVGFSDFFAQHNEHRIFFPRLVMFVLAVASGWNVLLEMWASVVFACISFFIMYLTLKKTLKTKLLLVLATITASFIFFSPIQFENWLWGWQVQWYLNILGLLIAVWALAVWKVSPLWRVVVAALGAILATYSLGSGFFVWLVCLPMFWFIKPLRRHVWLWILLGLGATAFYYIGYQSPGGHPPTHNIFRLAAYAVIYVTHPLALQMWIGYIVAPFLAATLLWVPWHFWQRARAELSGPVLAWMCLGLYVGLAAASTAYTRASLGTGQAYSSRYATISLLLVLALSVVLYKMLDLGKLSKIGKRLAIIALASITLLTLLNFAKGVVQMIDHGEHVRQIEQCAHVAASYHDPCLYTLYPSPGHVWPRLEYIRSIHWGGQ